MSFPHRRAKRPFARRKGKIGVAQEENASDDTGTIDNSDTLEGLGVVATTSVAAASGVLATIRAWLKGINFDKIKKGVTAVTSFFKKSEPTNDFAQTNDFADTQDYAQEVDYVDVTPRTAYMDNMPMPPNPNTTNPNTAPAPANSNMTMYVVGGVAVAGIITAILMSKKATAKKSLNGTDGLDGTKRRNTANKTATKRPIARRKTVSKTPTKAKQKVKVKI